MDHLSDTAKLIIGIVVAAVVIGAIVAVVMIFRNRSTQLTTNTFEGLDNAVNDFRNNTTTP